MKLRTVLLGSMAGLLFATSALAQCPGVNCTVPAYGIGFIARNPTYSATSVGLVPASAATDIFCISPGTTKDITIRRITIAGTAGTAITTPFLLYQRSTLDTAGTPAATLALPVAVPYNPGDAASTATLIAYTANPTVAATPLLMDALTVDLPVTTAAGGNITTVAQYGTSLDFFTKGMTLTKASTLQLCVNLNGATVSSGVLNIHMEWTEQ